MDQGGQVVGAHVEQRTAPGEKRNSGLGWEVSGPTYCMTVCADSGSPMSPRAMARRAVCIPWPSTVSGATPTSRPGRVGLLEQAAAALPVDADRLLGPDVFAGGDACEATSACTAGIGQVDHDLHLGMAQHVTAVLTAGSATCCSRLGRGTGLTFRSPRMITSTSGKLGQVLQVGVADHAGADEANTNRPRSGVIRPLSCWTSSDVSNLLRCGVNAHGRASVVDRQGEGKVYSEPTGWGWTGAPFSRSARAGLATGEGSADAADAEVLVQEGEQDGRWEEHDD